jgi:hypothetical protein
VGSQYPSNNAKIEYDRKCKLILALLLKYVENTKFLEHGHNSA